MVHNVGSPSQRWGTFLRNHARELAPSKIFPGLLRNFRSLITRIAGAVIRRLMEFCRNLLNLPATFAGRIIDEPVSCQYIHRLRHRTGIVPVGFAGRGPPVVKPPLNNSTSPGTSVAVVRLPTISATDTHNFRWRRIPQIIHLHHFPHRSDRLAA